MPIHADVQGCCELYSICCQAAVHVGSNGECLQPACCSLMVNNEAHVAVPAASWSRVTHGLNLV